MIAFIYGEDGTLQRCPYYGPMMLVALPCPPLYWSAYPRSRRERRRWARSGTVGRRGAKRVGPVVYQVPYEPMPVRKLVGHYLARRDAEAVLYLQEGEEVTDDHLRAVERMLTHASPTEAGRMA